LNLNDISARPFGGLFAFWRMSPPCRHGESDPLPFESALIG
jgi:hypothetical protein